MMTIYFWQDDRSILDSLRKIDTYRKMLNFTVWKSINTMVVWMTSTLCSGHGMAMPKTQRKNDQTVQRFKFLINQLPPAALEPIALADRQAYTNLRGWRLCLFDHDKWNFEF
jgi:hypothetical protein